MQVGANKEETVVNCAFQWAQRPDFVYLNVKFSSRIDGPVTVLNVDNERVQLGNDTLLFEAVGRQKPKTFKLNLTFHGAIDAERSSWSFGSVGRMSFTIAKAVNETWPRLLAGKAKPKNMQCVARDTRTHEHEQHRPLAIARCPRVHLPTSHNYTCPPANLLTCLSALTCNLSPCSTWYERQTALDAEVKEEAKVRKDKEAAEKKAEEDAKPATPPPLPPTPLQPEGSKGAGPAKPKKKKKKSKASGGGGGSSSQPKDEV